MKIVYLTHYYLPEGNAPATRVSSLAKRWVRDGNDVTVITGVPNVPNGIIYSGYKNKIFPQKETINQVSVTRLWTWLAPNKGTISRIVNYLSYMWSVLLYSPFIGRADVIIATSPQFFCGWAGVLLKWRFRVTAPWSKKPRFVLEIRDIWPESIGAVGAMNKGIVFRFLEFLEKRMYTSADHIVTVGSGYSRVLQERGVAEEKISIITNGIDKEVLGQSSLDSGSFRKKWGLEAKFVCSYIGTIGMASGLSIYLRAAKLLKQSGEDHIALVAVGDGAERSDLEKRAKEEGLDNLVFTGRCDKDTIPGILEASDVCFVHLRKNSLFQTVIPSKIFEAMAKEKPIIIGVEGEAQKIIHDAGCGVSIEPEDEQGLVTHVINLSREGAKLSDLGSRGKVHVEKYYDLDLLAQKYMECLKSVSR